MRVKLRKLLREKNLIYFDLVLILASVLGSFVLRLELGQFVRDFVQAAIAFAVISLLVKPFIYQRFGLYRLLWVYASTREMMLIVAATGAASGAVLLIGFLLKANPAVDAIPRSVYVIDWLLSVFSVGFMRFVLRVTAEGSRPQRPQVGTNRQVLIVGAGDAGALVVRELQKNPQINLKPIAILDDDPGKQGHQIHGVPVVGTLGDLGHELATRPLDEVIVAIPSAPGSVVRKVAEVCRERGILFRTMPGIYELVGGVISVSRLREVDITDLLRREPVTLDHERMSLSLQGKRVLITGAGGSIASELCRQIARWEPAELILLGHGENSIFEILLELDGTFPSMTTQPVIGDVRDIERMRGIFLQHQPDIIFHAAAHKHVHLMELNVVEAVTNNILGTCNVVDLALEVGIERLVMISTDKAVRPSSVMGATKRIAEMLVQDAAQRSGMAFSVVRFGNVLGSRGSVVPIFKRQIAQGGPITVRHPDIERYFMTIPEAVHLVLQASTLGKNGEMFALNMGEPVRIRDLAEDLIRLSGLEPEEDIEIVYTGLQPGEKLSEVLWDPGTEYEPTLHPDIFRLLEPEVLAGEDLNQIIEDLIRLARDGDGDAVVQILDENIPGATIRSTPPTPLISIS